MSSSETYPLHSRAALSPESKPASHTYSIGVDLGGTSLRVSALTQRGERLNSRSLPTRVAEGPDAVVADICDGILQSISSVKSARKGLQLRGVGLGSPGPLALPEGRLLHLPNFPGWDGFELKQALEARLGMSVIVESDANAAALAEWMRGAGQELEADSLCMLTLGTGVGNGIILNRRIWHGMNGMGGEAGHVPIFPDGEDCPCGGNGCLELYASATALRRLALRRAQSGLAPGLSGLAAEQPSFTARELADLADRGNLDAVGLFDDLGRAIGLGLAGLINTLNLPLYVVGGGLASAWHLFAPAMFRTVRHASYVYRLSEPKEIAIAEPKKTMILPALLGPDAGIIGAALLPYSESL